MGYEREAVETKQIENYLIEIFPDTDPESPRNWCNLGTMVCFHNRYNLGDEHDYDHNDYEGWGEMERAIRRNEDVAVILPLFLYDHSGITMNTTGFSCGWDSGQVGFIYVSKAKVREEYSVKRITKAVRERMEKYLEGEVETYDQYLTGDVYGYKISQVDTCDKDCEHSEEVDSCWGFYGMEYAMEEAESMVKWHIENDKKKATVE
jgi:hypothetical protein